MLTLTYIALAVIGCGYVLFAAFSGHMADFGGHDAGGHADAGADTGADAGADAGHADMHYGVDASGHGAASTAGAHAPAFHFPFFSPLALSALFGSIGGYGLAAKAIELSDTASILVAVPLAFVTAYAVTYVSFKVVMSSRGSSHILRQDIEGASGEVLTPIPAGGVGEVALLVKGQRYTSSAREVDGKELARSAGVKVVRVVGHTLVVRAL